jgi:hypothetical protein
MIEARSRALADGGKAVIDGIVAAFSRRGRDA